jgi:hypothetical protein
VAAEVARCGWVRGGIPSGANCFQSKEALCHEEHEEHEEHKTHGEHEEIESAGRLRAQGAFLPQFLPKGGSIFVLFVFFVVNMVLRWRRCVALPWI